jgi:hypothetical protein
MEPRKRKQRQSRPQTGVTDGRVAVAFHEEESGARRGRAWPVLSDSGRAGLQLGHRHRGSFAVQAVGPLRGGAADFRIVGSSSNLLTGAGGRLTVIARLGSCAGAPSSPSVRSGPGVRKSAALLLTLRPGMRIGLADLRFHSCEERAASKPEGGEVARGGRRVGSHALKANTRRLLNAPTWATQTLPPDDRSDGCQTRQRGHAWS